MLVKKIRNKFLLFSSIGFVIVVIASLVFIFEHKKITQHQDKITNLYSILNKAFMSVHKTSLLAKKLKNNQSLENINPKDHLELKNLAADLAISTELLGAWLKTSDDLDYVRPLTDLIENKRLKSLLDNYLSVSVEIIEKHVQTKNEQIGSIEYLSLTTQNTLGQVFTEVNEEIFSIQKNFIKRTETLGMLLVTICFLEILFVWFFVFRPLYSTIIDQHSSINVALLKLSKANESKTNFLANMSHEIRTPMTAILGYIDLLRKEESSKRVEDTYEVINRNAEHLMDLIDELLDISRIESGKLYVNKEKVELMYLLNDVYSFMNSKAVAKGLAFDVRYSDSLPKFVKTDTKRFRQILMNLIGNAIKFTKKGSVKVDLSLSEDEKFIQIKITDTGIGIDKKAQSKLFKPFEQADSSVKRTFGGTGLGLAISKRLSKLMGGSLEIDESILGSGSVFLFKLKNDYFGEDQEYQDKFFSGLKFDSQIADKFSDTLVLSKYDLLVVDDAKENARLFSVYLKKAGATVDIANNGQEAIDAVKSKKYDVVLLDLQMPDMSGYDVIREIQALKIKSEVFALTAHAMQSEKDKTHAYGFCGHITKPVQSDDLIQVIVDHMRKINKA